MKEREIRHETDVGTNKGYLQYYVKKMGTGLDFNKYALDIIRERRGMDFDTYKLIKTLVDVNGLFVHLDDYQPIPHSFVFKC